MLTLQHEKEVELKQHEKYDANLTKETMGGIATSSRPSSRMDESALGAMVPASKTPGSASDRELLDKEEEELAATKKKLQC